MIVQKVRLVLIFTIVTFLLINNGDAMTRQQLKNSGKLMKKSCMPKNDVTEEQIGEIEQGKFIEERNVMCYMACIHSMMQLIKSNRISYEAIVKQVDLMFPQELKEPMKAAADSCKDVAKKYKDICESAYWFTKCLYEYEPKSFIFP